MPFFVIEGKQMANDNEPEGREPRFSFGTRELREARRSKPLALAEPPPKPPSPAAADTGFDPYNTSGSFDRRKHWERVGKR
ncbi:MAG: hypothetical protein ABSC32_12945 [Steroidobacteraceae bacterium]